MKGLSIEEKAKRYDEAIEIAKSKIKNDKDHVLYEEDIIEIFHEFKESEDERIREQVLARKLEIEKAAMSYTGIIERTEWFIKGAVWADENPFCLQTKKQDEQKPADKVEPKFKVGDWIVNKGGKVNQVVAIDDDCDGFTLDDDTYFSGSWCDMYHLWTIQDAKEGDVLCCESGWTCIFKTLVNEETFSSYCFMDRTKWFCETGSECHTLKEEFVKAYNGKIYPATKEQRDLLFQMMKEAGYEWDAEKRELKKMSLMGLMGRMGITTGEPPSTKRMGT